LQLYDKNWAALEIMKTIIKNKRSYKSKIGRPYLNEDRSCGSQQSGGASGSGGSEANTGDVEKDSSEESSEEEDGTGAVSAGTKRKATGSAGKGKQRKL
jgi:hypothetical protein